MAFGNKIIGKSDIRNGWMKTLERVLGGGVSKGDLPVVSGLTVTESVGKTVITFTNVNVPTIDAGAAGAQASLKIYDFPEGLIQYVAGVENLTVTKVGAGIAATSTVIASVGTAVAAADLTLTGTEADLIPSGSVTLVAGTGAITSVSATANTAVFDGTATAKDAYLNFVVDATGSTANDALTVSGTITLAWSFVADK